MVKEFDLIVIGAGSGLNLIPENIKTALVEKGPMGGTCLNRGCIPSKIIIHSADVAELLKRADDFGIKASIKGIDFAKITKRSSKIVDTDAGEIEKSIRSSKHITLFKGIGKFIAERTLKVGKNIIKGKKIIIAAGARPTIPPIKGLDKVKYMTSTEALRITKQPKILTIIGGGYIAAELAHFYGALGTKINIVQRNVRLVPREDGEISEKFTDIFKKKYNVYLEHAVNKVEKKGKNYYVEIERKNGGGRKVLVSDSLLIATGVTPNSDTLDLSKTNVKVNKYGYIISNDYLETTAKNVWVLGDIAGKYLFKHSANLEAQYASLNALQNKRLKVDYKAMPHAIFSSPQIAGVGYTENELKEKGIKYAIGKYNYIDTGMGIALQDNQGFVKIMADPKTRKILGCHILGNEASTLIHEVILAMRNDLTVDDIMNTVHIHPALSEVIQRAAFRIK